MRKPIWYGLLLMAAVTFNAYAEPPATVAAVDIDRYLGKWYEIARFSNKFQKNCARNVTAEYARRADGRIGVINRCLKSDGSLIEVSGVVRIADAGKGAKLEVLFAPEWLSWIPFVWADYWVLDLAPDYSVSVVGEPSRENLWILSRTPQLQAATYEDLVNRVTAQGYDTARLIKTAQGQ